MQTLKDTKELLMILIAQFVSTRIEGNPPPKESDILVNPSLYPQFEKVASKAFFELSRSIDWPCSTSKPHFFEYTSIFQGFTLDNEFVESCMNATTKADLINALNEYGKRVSDAKDEYLEKFESYFEELETHEGHECQLVIHQLETLMRLFEEDDWAVKRLDSVIDIILDKRVELNNANPDLKIWDAFRHDVEEIFDDVFVCFFEILSEVVGNTQEETPKELIQKILSHESITIDQLKMILKNKEELEAIIEELKQKA